MSQQIFVNLPVKNLDEAIKFWTELGFSFNKEYTDETAACMVISETIFAMLLTHEKFLEFTTKDLADANKSTEVLVALTRESKDAVNGLVEKALELGATEVRSAQDYGFMYNRSFHDLDGHIWEWVWMNESSEQKE